MTKIYIMYKIEYTMCSTSTKHKDRRKNKPIKKTKKNQNTQNFVKTNAVKS